MGYGKFRRGTDEYHAGVADIRKDMESWPAPLGILRLEIPSFFAACSRPSSTSELILIGGMLLIFSATYSTPRFLQLSRTAALKFRSMQFKLS